VEKGGHTDHQGGQAKGEKHHPGLKGSFNSIYKLLSIKTALIGHRTENTAK